MSTGKKRKTVKEVPNTGGGQILKKRKKKKKKKSKGFSTLGVICASEATEWGDWGG